MRQYVSFIVDRLCMTVGELVMAFACIERVLTIHPTTVRVNSLRPMLLGASIIACKTSRDYDLKLWQVTLTPRTPANLPPCNATHMPSRPPTFSVRHLPTPVC